MDREFPGGPVVRTWHCHCHGPGSISRQGTKILQVMWRGKKKKKKKDKSTKSYYIAQVYSQYPIINHNEKI